MTYHRPALVLAVFTLACSKAEPPSAAPPSPPPPPAVVAAAAPSAAAPSGESLQRFEGEVELLAKSARRPEAIPPIALRVKGTKLRFDLPATFDAGPFGKHVHVVVNTAQKQLFAVLEDKKQVVTLNLESLSKELEGLEPPRASKPTSEPPPKVTKTGHIDSVAGRRCEDWEVLTAKAEKARVCVADEGVSWFELPSIGLPAEHAWARELFDGHHLPLRLIAYDAAGAETDRIEVTKLVQRAVADAELEVPRDYAVVDLAQLMRGFMAGMMPAGMMPGAPPPSPGPGAAPPPSPQGLPPGVMASPQLQQMLKRMQEAKAKAAKPSK